MGWAIKVKIHSKYYATAQCANNWASCGHAGLYSVLHSMLPSSNVQSYYTGFHETIRRVLHTGGKKKSWSNKMKKLADHTTSRFWVDNDATANPSALDCLSTMESYQGLVKSILATLATCQSNVVEILQMLPIAPWMALISLCTPAYYLSELTY